LAVKPPRLVSRMLEGSRLGIGRIPEMSSTQRLDDQRLHPKTPDSARDKRKILEFDPTRRTKPKQALLAQRAVRPVRHPFTIRGAIGRLLSFLFGTSRGRTGSRGTAPREKVATETFGPHLRRKRF
jgi:hypothetical protein